MITVQVRRSYLSDTDRRLCYRIAAYLTLLNVTLIIYAEAETETTKCVNSLKQNGQVSVLLLLDFPVSLQEGGFMAPTAVNRCVCTRAHDIEMPVEAQFILMKRLLHNTVKVNETLSNYLPRMCQSCKFNLPSASNFPPEHVSISRSDVCEVVLPDRPPPRRLTPPSAVCPDLQPQNLDDSPWF